jgi:hypothetical protein
MRRNLILNIKKNKLSAPSELYSLSFSVDLTKGNFLENESWLLEPRRPIIKKIILNFNPIII